MRWLAGMILFVLLLSTVSANPIPTDIGIKSKQDASPMPLNSSHPIYLKEEIIKVTFDSSEARFSGKYTFKSLSTESIIVEILFPFREKPRGLKVKDGDIEVKWRDVPINDSIFYAPFTSNIDGGLTGEYVVQLCMVFSLHFSPGEERTIRIEYRRDYMIYDSSLNTEIIYRFDYIIGTARAWGRPIDHALFEFKIPSSMYTSGLEGFEVRREFGYVVAKEEHWNWTPEDKYLTVRWEDVKVGAVIKMYLPILIPITVIIVAIVAIAICRRRKRPSLKGNPAKK
ncbi:MAG: hypothetical protein DRN28_04975 [Thermoplasmata archaeon]|nr:MAG: hypothetical protein DRN28_04975 [Thermoplasmata archaeon]